MKILNTLFLSAMLTLVAVPVAFSCPCKQSASNEAFLKAVGQNPNYKAMEKTTVRDIQ